jgi:hypothetical protein
MRKLVPLLLALALCLTLCACASPTTLDGALRKADKQIEKWNGETFNGYTYSGVYVADSSAYSIVMEQTWDNEIAMMYNVVEAAVEPIHSDMEKIFSNLKDTQPVIVIFVRDAAGNNAYIYNGRELLDFDEVMG